MQGAGTKYILEHVNLSRIWQAKPSTHDGNLTYAQKKAICEEKLRNDKLTHKELAEWSQTEKAINILQLPRKIRRKRIKIEAALLTSILQLQHRGRTGSNSRTSSSICKYAQCQHFLSIGSYSQREWNWYNNRSGNTHTNSWKSTEFCTRRYL